MGGNKILRMREEEDRTHKLMDHIRAHNQEEKTSNRI
jgi:hypothetical protein